MLPLLQRDNKTRYEIPASPAASGGSLVCSARQASPTQTSTPLRFAQNDTLSLYASSFLVKLTPWSFWGGGPQKLAGANAPDSVEKSKIKL